MSSPAVNKVVLNIGGSDPEEFRRDLIDSLFTIIKLPFQEVDTDLDPEEQKAIDEVMSFMQLLNKADMMSVSQHLRREAVTQYVRR